ncbi:MAG TPA: RluA family pseudouridine synthase [Kofleriaceae bacterium]|nr:RluA family pseudouridine synthase [Kofleriaceae bacterium]
MAGSRNRSPSTPSPAAAPRKLTTSGVDRGRTLADFLADRLPIDRAAADALVRGGAVYLDRRRIEDPSHLLGAAHRLTVHLPPTDARPPPPAPGSVTDWIVHQDSEVVVVDKPPGLPSQATRASSAAALDRLVAASIDPDARLLHRIDRGASGLVLFTRTPESRRRFAALLASYQLERTYCAAVCGHWQRPEGALSGSIGRDPNDHRRMVVGPGRPALTRFRLVRRGTTPGGEPVSLLQLDLVTGRTHQIRVHLSDAGHPICGDALYGTDRPALDRLFLHAHRLAWPGADPVVAPVPLAFSDLVG